MVAIKTFITATLALVSTADAARTFFNDGSLNGWDFIRRENQGTVQQVSNVAYKGTTSIKMTQTYTPGYNGRYHSEVDRNRGYKRGDSLYYGFMFRLSDTWQFSSQSYNIAQFIANRPGAGCGGDDWMPSSMVWIQGNQLTSRIVSGQYRQPNCGRSIKTLNNLGTVSAGKWHKVIIQAKWASDNSGFYRMWFDGRKVHDSSNVATTVNDDTVFQFRVGMYANSWHDDGRMDGNQPFRQMWFDEIAIGTELNDVDPDA